MNAVESAPQDTYLVTEVMTAAPQRLHLMLIEAAIRWVHAAREHRAADRHEQAAEALVRSQEIVGQLLAGLSPEAAPELVKRLAAEYLFIFRSLLEASHTRDQAKLADALRILEIQRDTWREVCRRVGTWGDAHASAAPAPPAGMPLRDTSSPSAGVRASFSVQA